MTTEINLLSPLNYAFSLARAPQTSYQVQSVYIPGYSLGSLVMPTPFTPLPSAGNIHYDDLTITFKVGEHLINYLEIFNWMQALGKPHEYSEYKGDTRSDCALVVLSSARVPILSFEFQNAYPVMISPINFDSTLTDVVYVTVTASFKYDSFSIKQL